MQAHPGGTEHLTLSSPAPRDKSFQSVGLSRMKLSSQSSTWPLSSSDLAVILAGLRTVFSRGGYLLLAICVGAAIFVLATWLPNARLAWQIGSSGSISFADKAKILTALIGSIATNFTIFSAISTMAMAGLFGANVAAMTVHVQPRCRHASTAGST